MKDNSQVSSELFDKIRSRFEDVTIGDENAKSTEEPEKAKFFNFDYLDEDGTNFGNITISLVDPESFKMFFGRKISQDMGAEHKDRWYQFLKDLRLFAKRNLLSFDPRDISRSKLKARDIKTAAKTDRAITSSETNLGESLMPGSRRLSYQDHGPIRIVIRHAKPIESHEPGIRSRHIDSIFLQNGDGERFRSPYKNLSVARALASHLAHGGQVNDDGYKKICGYVDDLKKISSFLRRSKYENYQDPEVLGLIKEAQKEYNEGRNIIKKIGGPRTYQFSMEELFERLAETAPDDGTEQLKHRLTKPMIDQRIETALPTISKLYHQRSKNKKVLMDTNSWLFEKDLISQIASKMGVYESALAYKSVDNLVDHVLETLKTELLATGKNKEVAQVNEWQQKYSNIQDSLEGRMISKFVSEVVRASKNIEPADKPHQRPKDIINELIDREFDSSNLKEIQRLFDEPMEFGPNGDNAIGAVSKLFGEDSLQDLLYKESRDNESGDARQLIKYWLMDNYPEIANEIDFEKMQNEPREPEPTSQPETPVEPAPEAPPAEPMPSPDTEPVPDTAPPVAPEMTTPGARPSSDINDLKRLSGL